MSSAAKTERSLKQAIWRSRNKEHIKAKDARRRMEKRAQCLINAARTRSRAKGILFELDGFEDELQARIDLGKCELSGIDLDLSPGRKPTSPSLDRIKPDLGYVRSNVRIICHAMNAALGDWGEDALVPIVESWLKRRASSLRPTLNAERKGDTPCPHLPLRRADGPAEIPVLGRYEGGSAVCVHTDRLPVNQTPL